MGTHDYSKISDSAHHFQIKSKRPIRISKLHIQLDVIDQLKHSRHGTQSVALRLTTIKAIAKNRTN